MDYLILKWINGLAGRNFWLDVGGIILAEFLIFCLPLIIILVYFFSAKRKDFLPFCLKIIFSLVIVYGLNYLISLYFRRPRPFIDHGEIYQLAKFFTKTTDYSFPSYHTAVTFIMAFAVLLDWRKFGIILLIPALLVGLGRVFVGVHYPTDVLGGIITALIATGAANFVFNYFKHGNT